MRVMNDSSGSHAVAEPAEIPVPAGPGAFYLPVLFLPEPVCSHGVQRGLLISRHDNICCPSVLAGKTVMIYQFFL